MEEKISEYQFYKSLGVCPVCHKRKPAPGHSYCRQCLDKKRDYQREHKSTYYSHLSDEEKQRSLENQKIRYYNHKANGLCVCCKRKATYGVFCEKHAREKRAAQMRSARKRGIQPRRGSQKLPVPKPKVKCKTDVGKIISLYNAGWKYKDISAEMRISESVISYWVKKAKNQAVKEV